MCLNLSEILFQIFCYCSIVMKLMLRVKVTLLSINFRTMVSYFCHSMMLFFILMRIKNIYVMVTYLRASKVLGLEHMDVQRLIISRSRDGYYIWDTLCSFICFTNFVVLFWGYLLEITVCVFELDVIKICYEYSI